MERVSSKHGPRLDEEQKQEEHALLHGTPDEGRTDARTMEAPDDDEPSMRSLTEDDPQDDAEADEAGDA
jgi:hypothetical protein